MFSHRYSPLTVSEWIVSTVVMLLLSDLQLLKEPMDFPWIQRSAPYFSTGWSNVKRLKKTVLSSSKFSFTNNRCHVISKSKRLRMSYVKWYFIMYSPLDIAGEVICLKHLKLQTSAEECTMAEELVFGFPVSKCYIQLHGPWD